MSAHYDTYDYPNYWIGRDYEHGSELIAIKAFLSEIPKIHTILEIGAGFGRLTPSYSYRARKVILTDPCSKLLKIAREQFVGRKNIQIFQSSLERLSDKIKGKQANLVIMVRVIHHIENLEKAFFTVNKILKPGGYFILEFANKMHLKATIREILKGNLTFRFDIFPSDRRSKRSKKTGAINFFNYHPDVVLGSLKHCGFNVVEKRSVSNVRSAFLKSLLSTNTLLGLENILQKPLSIINFGPSIFILARKGS